MKDQDLKRYEQVLLTMQESSREQINRMIQVVMDNDVATGEHDNCVSESIEKELLLEHTEETIQTLVRDAISRIKTRDYGRCQQCDHVIPKVRLDAIPFTPYCVGCERELEKESHRS